MEEIIADSMPDVPTHEIQYQKVKEKQREKEPSKAKIAVEAD